LTIVVVATLVALANGHAALIKPLAWNGPNPTNNPQPCGTQSNTPLATAAAIWQAGTTVSGAVQWAVIAGDGAGSITATLDLAGGHNFAGGTPVTLQGSTPTTPGQTYTFTVVNVPNVVCTGPVGTDGNPTCTLQIHGPNGWTGCTTITITDAAAAPVSSQPSTDPVCIPNISDLTFCTKVNGHRVLVPFGMNETTVDANTANTFNATWHNKKVFFSASNPGCAEAYQDYMCGLAFPLCANPTLGPCQVTCKATVELCGLNSTHKNLYDCSLLHNGGADSAGNCAKGVSVYGTSTGVPGAGGGLDGSSASAVGTFAALVATLLALTTLNAALRQ